MLTQEQKEFIQYWEQHRIHFNSFSSKLLRGLPMAMIFGLPIILFVGFIYIFFPDWYFKISNSSAGSLISASIAVCITIIFFAYFRMHFKWEMNEQLYQELLHKQLKENAA